MGVAAALPKRHFKKKKTYFQQVGMKVSKPVLLPVNNVFFFFLCINDICLVPKNLKLK